MKKQNYSPRDRFRTVGVGAASVMLAASLAGGMAPAPAYAAIGDKAMDTTTHYDATGVEDSSLRYAFTRYSGVDADGTIRLTVTKWATGATGWGTDKSNPYAGQYILSFTNDEFYKQIESIQLDGGSKAYLAKHDDGAMWTVAANAANLQTGLIAVVTNRDLKIKLKDGKTLESMGMDSTAIGFESVWVKGNGAIARESVSTGFIQKNDSMNKGEMDSNFTSGKMGNTVVMDTHNMRINSVHTFKPDENYLQTDYQWVLYIKEQIPKALLPYIETGEVEIYNSDTQGNPNSGRTVFKVSVDDTGLVDTSREAALTIIGNNTTSQRSTVRDNNNQIFWGTLGQSRNYTISYKVKEGVSLDEFSRVLNDYITQNNERMLFSSWLEADYLDNDGTKKDNGAAPKQLTGSYANSYLRTNDSDKDGLFDFVEYEYGTDIRAVDTDGDGVPDGQEVLTDKTDAKKAASYKPMTPSTKVVAISPAVDAEIAGTLPKPLIDDPSDASKKLSVTSQDAGNAMVKLVAVDGATGAIDETKVYATTTIPFDKLLAGEFTLTVPKNTIPEDVHTVKLVAYSPDGTQVAEAASTIDVATDASRYAPKAGSVTVDKGSTPGAAEAKNAIANTDELPEKASYSWATAPHTDDAGDTTGTVRVTYSDGTYDDVDVTVKVLDQAGKFDPTAQEISVDMGEDPNAEDGIANKTELPGSTKFEWETKPDTTNPGDTTGTIVVTYPDGSKDKVEVAVHVEDTRTDAQKNDPKGQKVTAELNALPPDAKTGIVDADALPAGTSYAWKATPSTAAAGTTKQTVVVTYADKTTDEVEVDFEVVDNRTDAQKHPVAGQGITTNLKGSPAAADGIVDADKLPAGTKVEWKQAPDTSRPGTVQGTIEVTFKDGSSTTVDVDVKVVDDRPDKDKFEPVGQKVTVDLGAAVPDAADAVGFAGGTLPTGATYAWKATPSTAAAGTTKQTVVVTYADNSSEEVQVDFEVVDNRTDAQKHEPRGQKVATPEGIMPPASEGVENAHELPDDVEYSWKVQPDVSKPGTSKGTVLVTYADKSTDEVEVEVTVQAVHQNAKYEPRPGSVKVDKGSVPGADQAKAAVANAADLPADAVYGWAAAPDTSAAGDVKGTVEVTYSDGTSDTVEVDVHVTDPDAGKTDAQKYDPRGQAIEAAMGGAAPDAADAIANKAELPDTARYEWATAPDTSKEGATEGVVKVTYADNTSDTVKVVVNVVDNRTDAQKHEPQAQGVTTQEGEVPPAAAGIANMGSLPGGTVATWKNPPDVSKSGTATGTVTVTYPDQTSDEISVQVEVRPKPVAPQNEQYDPQGKAVDADLGAALPDASEAIANKDALPADATYTWVKTPSTDQAGTFSGTVSVMYQDGTADTVEVTVNVVDNRSDAEKYTPVGQGIKAEMGTAPNAADAIANKADLPGTAAYEWATAPDTSKPGAASGTVKVTYPDGTSDEVAVNVDVVDSRSDADKYAPAGQDVTVEQGKDPAASDAIANKDELPGDVKIEWDAKPDTSKPGDATGTVKVTYPDGSFETVDVTVHVEKPQDGGASGNGNGEASDNGGAANNASDNGGSASAGANADAGSGKGHAADKAGKASAKQGKAAAMPKTADGSAATGVLSGIAAMAAALATGVAARLRRSRN